MQSGTGLHQQKNEGLAAFIIVIDTGKINEIMDECLTASALIKKRVKTKSCIIS